MGDTANYGDDDLFGCFGSDDEDGIENDNNNKNSVTVPLTPHGNSADDNDQRRQEPSKSTLRDPDCGVCRQLNAEKSLLMHVKNAIASSNRSYRSISRAELVLATIDDYCQKRAWMMHLGPEKSSIIQNVLRDRLNKFITRDKNASDTTAITHDKIDGRRRTFVCAELGTYCGYGSVQIAKTLSEYAGIDKDGIDFHLFTVEINPSFAQIARQVIDMSELSERVTVLQNEFMMNGLAKDVGLLLKEGIIRHRNQLFESNSATAALDGNEADGEADGVCIDFVLIDHDKDSYLDDLLLLERSGLVQKGTVVAADNVIFAQIDDYVSYMKDLHNKGITVSETFESFVEYSAPDLLHNGYNEEMYRDGIEISTYL